MDDCESKLTEAWHLAVTMAQGICMQCGSVTRLNCEKPRFTVKGRHRRAVCYRVGGTVDTAIDVARNRAISQFNQGTFHFLDFC